MFILGSGANGVTGTCGVGLCGRGSTRGEMLGMRTVGTLGDIGVGVSFLNDSMNGRETGVTCVRRC